METDKSSTHKSIVIIWPDAIFCRQDTRQTWQCIRVFVCTLLFINRRLRSLTSDLTNWNENRARKNEESQYLKFVCGSFFVFYPCELETMPRLDCWWKQLETKRVRGKFTDIMKSYRRHQTLERELVEQEASNFTICGTVS